MLLLPDIWIMPRDCHSLPVSPCSQMILAGNHTLPDLGSRYIEEISIESIRKAREVLFHLQAIMQAVWSAVG